MPAETPSGQTPQQHKATAARWLRGHGYPDAEPVPGGSETGVDIKGAYVLARVYSGTGAVTRTDVQLLVGSRGDADADLAIFTSSRYELPALTYADSKGVMLFACDENGIVLPKNGAARAVLPREELPAAPASSGPWLPVLRHAPLGIAIYQFAFTAVLLVNGARTGVAPDFGNVAFGLVVGLALVAFWFFVTRKVGRGGSGVAPGPGSGKSGHPG